MTYPYQCVQIDTHNNCNLKCNYCYPQNCESEHGIMHMNMIEDILRQIGHRPLIDVRPFLNGDTLLEYRIHEICHMIKKYTGAKIVTFTNGTIYENKKLLKDINLDEVHFTVSAGTRKKYEKINGHDLFNEAAKTIKWFEKNKYPNQNIVIHMVLVNDNIHEVKQFKEN